jgi:transposase
MADQPARQRHPRRARPLPVSADERRQLESWIRAGTTPQRVVKRARIVLLAADGLAARSIAARLHVSQRTALLWRRRYQKGGPQTLWRDAPGRGRPPTIDDTAVARVRELLASTAPQGGRWSVRGLAKATGLSRASVHRILRASRVDPESDT